MQPSESAAALRGRSQLQAKRPVQHVPEDNAAQETAAVDDAALRGRAEVPEKRAVQSVAKGSTAVETAAADDAALARHHESLRQRIMREAERDIAEHVPSVVDRDVSGRASGASDNVARQLPADSAVRTPCRLPQLPGVHSDKCRVLGRS